MVFQSLVESCNCVPWNDGQAMAPRVSLQRQHVSSRAGTYPGRVYVAKSSVHVQPVMTGAAILLTFNSSIVLAVVEGKLTGIHPRTIRASQVHLRARGRNGTVVSDKEDKVTLYTCVYKRVYPPFALSDHLRCAVGPSLYFVSRLVTTLSTSYRLDYFFALCTPVFFGMCVSRTIVLSWLIALYG